MRLAWTDSGLLSADLAAGIWRVKGVKKLGVRLGNWLTRFLDWVFVEEVFRGRFE